VVWDIGNWDGNRTDGVFIVRVLGDSASSKMGDFGVKKNGDLQDIA